jgi:riboflavin synthase
MFTGLVTTTGHITARENYGAQTALTIAPDIADFPMELGDSIAVSGICLTVASFTLHEFTVILSSETLARTTAQHWQAGARINLEPALRMGDRLGGHLVSGHVDGIAQLSSVTTHTDCHQWDIAVPTELRRYLPIKGSLTLDGVSLTINALTETGVALMLIPHTLSVTTLGKKQPGDVLNLEVDLLARYMERLMEGRA